MKKLFLIAGLLAGITFCAKAGFQQIDLTSTTNTSGVVVAADFTNYYTAPDLALGGSRIICLQVSFSCMASNTGNVNFKFAPSTDAVRYNTNWFNWAVPANGTTSVNLITNIDAGAALLLKLQAIDNDGLNTGIVTNLVVEAYTKSGQ